MVEVIEGEVALLQILPLPIGLSQICGCSISSVLSLINWRGFKLQEQAASKLYQDMTLTAARAIAAKLGPVCSLPLQGV